MVYLTYSGNNKVVISLRLVSSRDLVLSQSTTGYSRIHSEPLGGQRRQLGKKEIREKRNEEKAKTTYCSTVLPFYRYESSRLHAASMLDSTTNKPSFRQEWSSTGYALWLLARNTYSFV